MLLCDQLKKGGLFISSEDYCVGLELIDAYVIVQLVQMKIDSLYYLNGTFSLIFRPSYNDGTISVNLRPTCDINRISSHCRRLRQ